MTVESGAAALTIAGVAGNAWTGTSDVAAHPATPTLRALALDRIPQQAGDIGAAEFLDFADAGW
jgi:hypothetical protein